MKGMVFVEFMEHAEARYGLDVMDEVLQTAGESLATGGAYTSVGNYPHEEMLALAGALCQVSGKSLESLLDDFADALMVTFGRMHPEFFAADQDIFDFFETLESRIHADVRKLYPDARPPLILTRRIHDGSLEMSYQSTRPLAPLAMALARAAGHKFGQALTLEVISLSEDKRAVVMRVRRQVPVQ